MIGTWLTLNYNNRVTIQLHLLLVEPCVIASLLFTLENAASISCCLGYRILVNVAIFYTIFAISSLLLSDPSPFDFTISSGGHKSNL